MMLALLLAVQPFVTVDVGSASGYQFPFLAVGGGLKVESKHALLDAQGLYSRTGKIEYGRLAQSYGSARVTYFLGRAGVGGGAKYAHLAFLDIGDRRSSLQPFLTAGIRVSDSLLTADLVFPGYDSAYRIYRFVAHIQMPLAHHVDLGAEVTGLKMRNTSNSYFATTLESDISIRVHP